MTQRYPKTIFPKAAIEKDHVNEKFSYMAVKKGLTA